MKKKKKKKKENDVLKVPVVVVLGHVDHGKTTLLDYIRTAKVASQEHGGITQSIGAYQVEIEGKKITFIDTPGHAAFSSMRSHGSSAADIAILVVAADDGVMPQTIEAINLAKAAGIPIIVAINKIDLQSADVSKVKKQLSEQGVLLEGWGGDTVCVEISALKGTNVDKLLDALLLVAEMQELKANLDAPFVGTVIESTKDPKKGAVATVIVKEGVLEVGSFIVAEDGQECKVRALVDFRGKPIRKAAPGDPVEIMGFKEPVEPGLLVASRERDITPKASSMGKEILVQDGEGKKTLNVIVKAGTQGSLEAIKSSILDIKNKEARVRVLSAGVGNVNGSDVLLAASLRAIILAFNVKVPKSVQTAAEAYKVIIRTYNVIYELIEEVEGALEGVLELEEEKVRGRAEVIKLFKLPKSGDVVAGSRVLAGRLKVKDKVEIWPSIKEVKEAKEDEDKEEKEKPSPLHIATIKSLHIEAKEVKLAGKDSEVGVYLSPQFSNIEVGNIIEVVS